MNERASIRREIRITAPADEIWAVVGNPTRLPEWFPGVVSCEVDGDTRTVTAGAGRSMTERVVTIDRLQRRFQYRITAPMFREHLGTIDVIDLGDSTCLVVYGTDAVPAMLALAVGGATGQALANLRALVEAGGPSSDPDGTARAS
ncbi:MAG: SRPBCC family protein [Actinomycetota bacterium]|nr:SRPBCC family protein [Actinomycetota bacterium]